MKKDPVSNKVKNDNLKFTQAPNLFAQTICAGDNAAKFTKVLYNLTPAGKYISMLLHSYLVGKECCNME